MRTQPPTFADSMFAGRALISSKAGAISSPINSPPRPWALKPKTLQPAIEPLTDRGLWRQSDHVS